MTIKMFSHIFLKYEAFKKIKVEVKCNWDLKHVPLCADDQCMSALASLIRV